MSPAARKQRVYLDTSAYLAVLLNEDGATKIVDEAAGAELLSSVLLVLEARRHLVRLAREGVLDAAGYEACMARVTSDIEQFELRDPTLDLGTSRALPAVATPRSLDLAHLRTALWFHAHEPIGRFVTLDAAQAQAARELGLPV